MRLCRSVIALTFMLILWGCGSGGLLNLNPQPTGNITITNSATGATLQTTFAQPFLVTGGAFSIGITEDHFSGPYAISISTWTAPFSLACFVPHYVDQTDKTNVVKFSADNATPVTDPTQASPCNPFIGPSGASQTDEETAQINDGKGHTATFYYQLEGTAPTTGTGSTPSATTPTALALSWASSSPTGAECGAYVLNVGALNSSGAAVATTGANPITLTTTGGGYMGFSAVTGAAGFTCPASTGTPPVGSPGGTATLQLTTSPTQVLVYFNGFNAAATTTITASSVGLKSVPTTIANAQSTTVASIKLAWNGAAPTAANCGAFVLNVKAFNASGAQITSSQYSNPITLSTTGGAWSGFSTVFAGITPAPSANTFFCGSAAVVSAGVIVAAAVPPAVGTPTLAVPDTATPSVVYYDGPYDIPFSLTTITATAAGVTGTQDGTVSF